MPNQFFQHQNHAFNQQQNLNGGFYPNQMYTPMVLVPAAYQSFNSYGSYGGGGRVNQNEFCNFAEQGRRRSSSRKNSKISFEKMSKKRSSVNMKDLRNEYENADSEDNSSNSSSNSSSTSSEEQ